MAVLALNSLKSRSFSWFLFLCFITLIMDSIGASHTWEVLEQSILKTCCHKTSLQYFRDTKWYTGFYSILKKNKTLKHLRSFNAWVEFKLGKSVCWRRAVSVDSLGTFVLHSFTTHLSFNYVFHSTWEMSVWHFCHVCV